MSYLLIPFLVIIILAFKSYLKQNMTPMDIRENICVIWCIIFLFSLLGGIISFHLYQYNLMLPLTWGLAAMLLLYLALALLFIVVSPSGYRRLFRRSGFSPEELLYAEYRFNHTLEMARDFFLMLLLIVPSLFCGYECIRERFTLPLLLEEAYLIGGLYFVTFCILCPIALRQSFFWLRQLQRIPPEYETELLQNEHQRFQYHRKNRRI